MGNSLKVTQLTICLWNAFTYSWREWNVYLFSISNSWKIKIPQFKSLSQASIWSLIFWIAFLLGLVLHGVGWGTLVFLGPGNPSGRKHWEDSVNVSTERVVLHNYPSEGGSEFPLFTTSTSTPSRDFRDWEVFLDNVLFLKGWKKETLGVNVQKTPCHPRETMVWALSFVLEGVAMTVILSKSCSEIKKKKKSRQKICWEMAMSNVRT